MMSVFARLARTSCLGFQRLRSLSTSSSFSQISADTIDRNNNSLLINQGNPYLEIHSNIDNGSEDVFKLTKTLCFPTESSLFQLYACGPCNGVLCVYSSWQYVSLLNPATRDITHITFPPWHAFAKADIHLLGFGFDSKAKDFKIVRSATYLFSRCLWRVEREIHRIEIFSLNSMDMKELPVTGEIRSLRPSLSSVPSIDGVCYWSAKDANMRVVSFDFADEVFDVFTLPPCDYPNYSPHTEDCLMQTFNGLPAAIRYDANPDKYFEIWVKKKETWIKDMSIGPISDVIKPLCFMNNEGLVLVDSEYQFILYDFATKQLKKLDIKTLKSFGSEGKKEPLIQALNLPQKLINPSFKLATKISPKLHEVMRKKPPYPRMPELVVPDQ